MLPPATPPPSRVVVLPGTLTSCILLTVLTVLLAGFAQFPPIDAALRPLYFALLAGYLIAIGRRDRRLVDLPFRLVRTGAVVWTLAAAAAAVLRMQDQDGLPEWTPALLAALERGAVFLLGMTLVAYGILLWLPQLVAQRRELRTSVARARGRLRSSEQARARVERHAADVERMRVLSELAAGIAHDLRNPLAIVSGAAQALRARTRDPEAVAEHVDVILRNVDKAERTIRTLLDLGKPGRVQIGDVPLAPLFDELAGLVGIEARRRDVALTFAADAHVVAADRALLLPALVNLVLNALQASSERGTVVVRARAFADSVAIAVEDRGVGIAPDARTKLFTPFHSTKHNGTGLGLVSCRRLVDDMGGRVGLFARRRGGARAIVVLPSAHADAAVAR